MMAQANEPENNDPRDGPKGAPPGDPLLARSTKVKKRQIALLALSVLGLSLLVMVQRRLLDLGPGLSSNQGVITLVSINFSVLTLAFLLYLILRGLYKVFFERTGYGSLQTKMVVSFISLSLMPTILIFYFAYLLIGQDHDTWFGRTIRGALSRSLSVATDASKREAELFRLQSDAALAEFGALGARAGTAALPGIRERNGLASLEWYSKGGDLLASSFGPMLQSLPHIPPAAFGAAGGAGGPSTPANGEYLQAAGSAPERRLLPLGDGPPSGFLAAGRAPGNGGDIAGLESELRSYEAALSIERPFKVTQLTTLAAVTLLAVFLSIWIGSNLAKSLAAPVTELVEGTRKVAQGDLDFELQPTHRSGEMAHLVTAFNLMTRDLKASYQELDQRRRFVETVLREVSTGVIVLDESERVMTVNRAAASMLGLGPVKAQETGDMAQEAAENAQGPSDGAPAEVAAGPAGGTPAQVLGLLRQLGPGASGAPGRVFLELPDGSALSLSASKTSLKGESGEPLGWLLTFDDVSDLEKAQRLAAWREVARRIAHEVKNPLTPISLAAQRLERRFLGRIGDENEAKIFEDCVGVIVRQVENMRALVSEFSEFARLPAISPRPSNLAKVVEGGLALFREAHPGITYSLEQDGRLGDFVFDPEQLGRAVTNILGNATAALKGEGRVDARISLDGDLGVELRIEDDGPGIPKPLRARLFEPYVSSSTGGQGLGLSIVKTIVNDHGGFVRVEDRRPKGTAVVITLPYVSPGPPPA
ncbi:MAG: HAMP domain-containing protein [Deltaproteobacteria bacterium]|jgi:two-component system nitrogen regulation sensor histidine kinase NtrY|nr:HAMP domain-containing protein [Deltaproteobacteria bacterium]